MAAKTALIIHDAWKLLSRKGQSAYFLQTLEFAYLLPNTPNREWFFSSSVHTAIKKAASKRLFLWRRNDSQKLALRKNLFDNQRRKPRQLQLWQPVRRGQRLTAKPADGYKNRGELGIVAVDCISYVTRCAFCRERSAV